MQTLRNPADVNVLKQCPLRALLTKRFAELALDEPYDPGINGFFIIVEAGDVVADIGQVSGCNLLGNRFSDARFGDPGFLPDWECLEFHADCDGSSGFFEMVFVLSDDGYGVVILIPRQDGIDPTLLTLCETYASSYPKP